MKVGDTQRIMGLDAVVWALKTIDGVEYELYGGVEGGGAIRVVDVDSGEVVAMSRFKAFAIASDKYSDTIKRAT